MSGNVGASQAHLLEGYSIPYRAVMTSLPIGSNITLVLGYDIKHSGLQALDYLTTYNRLLPHGVFGHDPELINPIGGVSGIGSPTEARYAIPPPGTTNSPVPGQPATSFNALPPVEREMSLWGGTFDPILGGGTAIQYVTQGSLTASQAETTIAVSFKATQSTVVLAWGGHIARGDEWAGLSASVISGSPYHMRTKSWNLNNVGNQDRSLSAGAVINPPKLIVIKEVINDDGGDAVAGDFTMNVSGGATPSSFPGAVSPGTTVNFADTATYAVTEPGIPAGYTKTDQTPDCSGTIQPDQTKTCTITNDDVAPTLKLVKNVTNDDGGNAVADNWTLTADAAGTDKDGRNISTAGGSDSPSNIFANLAYTLDESTVAGYAEGTWSCSDAADPNRFSLTGSAVTLDEGAVVTCEITNNDVAPTLKLVKSVTNDDGGNAVANDWTLTASAAGTDKDDKDISTLGGSGDFEPVYANLGYTLAEDSETGYAAGSWSCDGGTLVGSVVTLAAGQTGVTCEITNNDVAPTLKLVKNVTKDDGGDAVANDWTLTANAAGDDKDDRDISTPGGSDSPSDVYANKGYALAESTVAGYTAGTWSCSDAATPDKFTLTGSSVTLDEGAAVTCEITNNDVAPTLKLVKNVTKDDGGDAVANDWTLTANAAGDDKDDRDISTPGGSDSPSDVYANKGYALAESTVAGYTAGTWSCSDAATPDKFTLTGSSVTLDEGAAVTCEITNNDVAPTLKLVKNVTKDDGGDAVANDWTLTANAAGDDKDDRDISTPGGSDSPSDVYANKGYALAESTVAGYTAGTWSCSDAATPDKFTLTGSSVTLDEGAAVTCEITNNDVAPTLKLVKNVVNDFGGTNEPDDWTLTANAAGDDKDDRDISTPGGSDSPSDVYANKGYALAESGPVDPSVAYTAGTWSCSDAATPDKFTLTGSSVTLEEGSVVTCQITNSDALASPTGTTVQHWVLHDTLSIDGIRPGAPNAGTATVTFRLFSDTGCNDQVGVDEVVGIVSDDAATVLGVTVAETGEYRWRAAYSGDSFNNPFETGCGSEITQIFAKDDLMVGNPLAPRNNILVPFPS